MGVQWTSGSTTLGRITDNGLAATLWGINFFIKSATGDCRVIYATGGLLPWEIGINVFGAGKLSVLASGWIHDTAGDTFASSSWASIFLERYIDSGDFTHRFRLYHNGTLHFTSGNVGMPNLDFDVNAYVGAEISGPPWATMGLAEVSFWNFATAPASATLAAALAAGDSPMSYAGALAYTRLQTTSDLSDLTGNGHTWTLANGSNTGDHPSVLDPPAGASGLLFTDPGMTGGFTPLTGGFQ